MVSPKILLPRRAAWLTMCACATAFVPVACRRSTPAAPTPAASASASASAAPTSEPPPRCRAVDSEGLRTTLGSPAPAASSEEGDDAVGLPFSPEVGGGIPIEGGFLAGVLESSKEGTDAALVFLSPGAAAPKRIGLGRVHGDVLAPRVIAHDKSVVAIVPDGAPNGSILRFAAIADVAGSAQVTWGHDLPQGNDESETFSAELGDKSLVVVWDEWDSKESHSIVKSASYPSGDVSKSAGSTVISNAHDDAEAPALALRPGGFWAAWITNLKREPDKKERSETSEAAQPVDMGPRWLTVVPLDAAGKPSAQAVAVTSKTGHVQGFDLAGGRDGSALVVWREDTTSPATPGGAVRVALVRADGSVDVHPIDDDDVGAGAPALFVDDAPDEGAPSMWLSLVSETDTSRLAALDQEGRVLDDVVSDPVLGAATPLAVRGGRVLVARPRGKSVALEVIACKKKTVGGAQ